MLKFQGAANFRARVIMSTLSGIPIRIEDIRHTNENPGVRDYEVSFLKLITKVSYLAVPYLQSRLSRVRQRQVHLSISISQALLSYLNPVLFMEASSHMIVTRVEPWGIIWRVWMVMTTYLTVQRWRCLAHLEKNHWQLL